MLRKFWLDLSDPVSIDVRFANDSTPDSRVVLVDVQDGDDDDTIVEKVLSAHDIAPASIRSYRRQTLYNAAATVAFALTAALLVLSALGCEQKRDWAPVLQAPERPILQPISQDRWRTVPKDVREIVAKNMELVIRHTEALEHTIRSYNAWQAGQTEN